MLFQRLYNWIKYKTLPPSLLFKNRLFVERDSKHRRIFNNFGLTFRNSKWSNYEMYNVKFHFQWTYYKYFFALLFAITASIILFGHSHYRLSSPMLNLVSFFFWTGIDAFDYYSSFLIWSFVLFISLFVNSIYLYFFGALFGDSTSFKKIFSAQFFVDNRILRRSVDKQKQFKKNEYKILIYSWISSSESVHKEKLMTKLFSSSIINHQFELNLNFFKNLFLSTYFCKLSLPEQNALTAKENLEKLSSQSALHNQPLSDLITSSVLANKYACLSLWYMLDKNLNYFNAMSLAPNTTILFKNHRWSCSNVNTSLKNFSYLVNFKSGGFNLFQLNFAQLHSYSVNTIELSSLAYNVKIQTQIGKWNRWLYRYSIMHRKLLKNSHKITITKRLVHSGFFNRSMFEKNVWASEFFNKNLVSPLFIANASSSLYSDYMKQNVFSCYLQSKSLAKSLRPIHLNLNLISTYEASFFWFVKRFYIFNSLHSNLVSSSWSQKTFSKKVSTANLQNIQSYLNYCALSSEQLNLNFAFSSTQSRLKLVKNNLINFTCVETPKDLSLNFTDLELLSHDHLNILYWVSSSTAQWNQKINWFSYFNYSAVFIPETLRLSFKPEISSLQELNFWVNYPRNTTELSYLSDLQFFSQFY